MVRRYLIESIDCGAKLLGRMFRRIEWGTRRIEVAVAEQGWQAWQCVGRRTVAVVLSVYVVVVTVAGRVAAVVAMGEMEGDCQWDAYTHAHDTTIDETRKESRKRTTRRVLESGVFFHISCTSFSFSLLIIWEEKKKVVAKGIK